LFTAESGGQVEGRVVDNENGWLFVGEEPLGLWRYDAEPDSDVSEGFSVDVVSTSGGNLYADVEGVTLVPGKTNDEGFIIVSCQGVSAYNIYRRASPHDFVMTFTIAGNTDGSVDRVSSTDGIAVIGDALNADFPNGLFVTHDDAKELPEGGTSEEASFKLVSLEIILGAEAVTSLGLLRQVDTQWNPRSS